MVGFFSRKAKNRAELLENESRRLGEKRKFKVVGKKTLSHEAYEHLIQNLLLQSTVKQNMISRKL